MQGKREDDWLNDASGNPAKRKLIKEMKLEQGQAEALRFQAQMRRERPKIRADWGLSEYFHERDANGEFQVSRIRFLLPFAISESLAKRLVERFESVFEELVFEKKEE